MSALIEHGRRVLLGVAIAVPVLLAIAGGIWSGTRTETITAETTLVVAPGALVAEDPGLSVAATDLLRDEAAVATLAALAEDEAIQDATLRDLGLGDGASDVSFEIATPPRSTLVRVAVAAPTGDVAASVRDAIVERITAEFEGSYPVLAVGSVESVVDDEPSGGLPILIGVIAGLVVGAVLSWLALSLRVYLSTLRD